ncbi:MAG TPA: cupin domain-containing protein [Gemmatimonadota bacterium]|nr:cupin domain-containing protein [Gemmatimonadota bacterium]
MWEPRVAAEPNGQEVKLAKLKGEFVWHRHDDADELFLIVKGRIVIRFRDGDVRLEMGQMLVVPRGVEHQPVAEEEAWVLLFEPRGVLNTGDVRDERTVDAPPRLESLPA